MQWSSNDNNSSQTTAISKSSNTDVLLKKFPESSFSSVSKNSYIV